VHSALDGNLTRFGTVNAAALVNDIASGNLVAPMQMVRHEEAAAFRTFMVASYDTAFHDVLTILTGICVLLSVVVVALLGLRARASLPAPPLPTTTE